ncbi:hypothetical protein [Deinococcus maricopensis]|uniref:Colicin V production protein n=1 Tax=Deinococcus maricopensis (strain DSM 21211 / LMG 22137 / NRRL B-23946 / LB-34) TaxID=709986 RepID=E8U6Q4_DEIML|nr:hypothetical protein [Deinococcus maricopensis]ADV66743.1 hypothetical protein Deima_1090 [Deinococcus maricopensis DSM 21211]
MITWFDALLVTVLAGVTALGMRRGLIGGVWGLAGIVSVLVANLLVPNAIVAAVIALVLAFLATIACVRAIPDPVGEVWHLIVGGVGGFALGVVLVGALALGFPIKEAGRRLTYPSSDLPPVLYSGIVNSYIQARLAGVWTGGQAAHTLFIPDYLKR